jgi:hypothetical protein
LVLEQGKDRALNSYQVKNCQDQDSISSKAKPLASLDSTWESKPQDRWTKLIFQGRVLMMIDLSMLLEICPPLRKYYLSLIKISYSMSGKHDEKSNMDVPGPG